MPVVAIEHVGSTAVEGLAAKPVIDVDIVVTAEHVAAASAALESIGYEPLGTVGIEDRWAFKAPGTIRTNTYVVLAGSLALRNHLGVRDVLRGDDALRARYAEVKCQLASTSSDAAAYVEGKSAILSEVLTKAGLDQADLDLIEQANRA